MSELRQLKAAAGSGKTYALTERLLGLLGGAEQEAGTMACAPGPGTSYAWPEILAATFTNKAAAEMKERVVAAIKRTALDIPSGQRADWSARRAEIMLERMLRRYHQLNIRTIDSLLNMLLRVFALDAGLPPDFEPVFDLRPPFNAAMDRIVAACEAGDEELAALHRSALQAILEHERDSRGSTVSGLWVTERMGDRIFKLVEHLLLMDTEVETDQTRLAALLVPAYDTFNQALDSLHQCIEGNGLLMDKRFTRFLSNCHGLELFDGPPSSNYGKRETLEQSVLKKAKALVSPAAESCWHDFRSGLERYREMHAALQPAYAMAPSVRLARRTLALMDEAERASGQVLSLTMPARVRALLDGETGVPDAFCRLGSRLHHLLMDEFQDTSRDQWAALAPLAEECLAKGGSLFYVGDVKQAIYGWRGGDATLFDEIVERPGLADIAEEVVREPLECNWRSKKEIVDFNNDLFSRLTAPDAVGLLADTVLSTAPEECRQRFVHALEAAYEDPAQRLPPDQDRQGGYVRLTRLPGGLAADIEGQTRTATGELVMELRKRRPAGDICLLVRKKAHASLLCDELVERGVPVITESSLRLSRHPAVRQLAALLAVADFPAHETALATVILGELFQSAAGLQDQQMTTWMATRPKGPLHLALRECFPDAWEAVLAPFVSKAGLMTPYDLASDAARLLRADCVFPDSQLFIKRFLELVHRAGEQGYATLADFLEFWDERGDEEKVSLPESVDAVRIMTMHKAKGLQFPVVVVPFLNWLNKHESEPVTVRVEGTPVLTRMGSGLSTLYYDKQADEALEQLNLLYVAFTRAEEELYSFLPGEIRGQRGPAFAALDLLLPLDELRPVHECGAPAASTSTPVQPPAPFPAPPPTDEGLMGWLPRLRVYRHMEDTADFARLRGEAAHRAMELLRPSADKTLGPDDLLRARVLAVNDYPALACLPEQDRTRLEADLDAMLAWVGSHHELPILLASGRAEMPMIDADGGLRRADFVHLGDQENVVLEFKTGGANPAHARQVRDYLEVLRAARPDTPARGLVVYLDRQTVEPVED